MLALVNFFFPHAAVFLFLAVLVMVITTVWLSTGWLWSSYYHISKVTIKNGTTAKAANVPVPALSLEAWTHDSPFQLERRSIFSQTWLCVAHRGRFEKSGDYLSLDLAEFHVFLILGKDGVVRAFHNVCRHRAFPVISQKASGRSTVLACQYHGWTYNTLGQLTNAPHFDQLPDFSKLSNSLFEVRSRTDSHGFVHINLNGSDEADKSAMKEAVSASHPIHMISSSSQFIYSWKGTGQFNWKAAGISQSPEIHTQNRFRNLLAKVLPTSYPDNHIHFFPLTTVHTNINGPYWYHVVYTPDSPQQTTVRCDVYTAETTGGSSIFSSDAKDRLESHLQLLMQTKERFHASIVGGILPAIDKESLIMNSAYYARLDALMKAHRQLERIQGRQVCPASVQHCHSASFEQAEKICQAMMCSNTELEW